MPFHVEQSHDRAEVGRAGLSEHTLNGKVRCTGGVGSKICMCATWLTLGTYLSKGEWDLGLCIIKLLNLTRVFPPLYAQVLRACDFQAGGFKFSSGSLLKFRGAIAHDI